LSYLGKITCRPKILLPARLLAAQKYYYRQDYLPPKNTTTGKITCRPKILLQYSESNL